jgi:hypothetical protein
MASIQNSEMVFDYMEPSEAYSEELSQLEKDRIELLKKMDEVRSAVSSRLTLQRFFARTAFAPIEDINFQEIASSIGHAVQGLAPGPAGVHVVHAKH